MLRTFLRLTCIVASLTSPILPAYAQVGHPVKGTWIGFWGAGDESNRMVILLDWDDRQIKGTINPGPDAVPIEEAEINYDTWTLDLTAELPAKNGGTQKWHASGVLDNLGSWSNRRYSGTYSFGDTKGEFVFTRQ